MTNEETVTQETRDRLTAVEKSLHPGRIMGITLEPGSEASLEETARDFAETLERLDEFIRTGKSKYGSIREVGENDFKLR